VLDGKGVFVGDAVGLAVRVGEAEVLGVGVIVAVRVFPGEAEALGVGVIVGVPGVITTLDGVVVGAMADCVEVTKATVVS